MHREQKVYLMSFGTLQQIQLEDHAVLETIGKLLMHEEGPFLQVGGGEGAITKKIPEPKVIVESDLRYMEHLKNYNVYFCRVQQVFKLKQNPRIVIANLPFNQCYQILKHCCFYFKTLQKYFVIVQVEWFQRATKKGQRLYFLMHHLFKSIKIVKRITGSCFRPKRNANAVLLELIPSTGVTKEYLKFLEQLKKTNKNIKWLFPSIPLSELQRLGHKKITMLKPKELQFLWTQGCTKKP